MNSILDDKAIRIHLCHLDFDSDKINIRPERFTTVKAKNNSGIFIMCDGVVLGFSPNDKPSPDGEYTSLQVNFGDYQLECGLKRQSGALLVFLDIFKARLHTFGHFRKERFDSWSVVPYTDVPF